MPKYKPLPPLERLNELFEVVEIPPDKYGELSGLVWKVRRGGRQRIGSAAGGLVPSSTNPERVDWKVGVDDFTYVVSRIIYCMISGGDPGDIQVDHEDQNSLNNNAWNLRLDTDGTIKEINKPKRRDNITGVTGVCWHKAKEKWHAQVRIEGRTNHLGYYTCKAEAARVVRDKWIELGWHEKGRKLPNLENVQCDCGACKR